jgi:hypothetical protein
MPSEYHWTFYEWQQGLINCNKLGNFAHGVHTLLVHDHTGSRLSKFLYSSLTRKLSSSLPPEKTLSTITQQEVLDNNNIFNTANSFIIFLESNLVTKTSMETTISFFNHLRAAFTEDFFTQKPLFLVMPFWAWDILHDRRLLSVADYHEYLCWDDNHLLSIGESQGTDTQFFQGSGFHAPTEAQRYPNLDSYSFGDLNNDYEKSLNWLNKQNECLAALEKSSEVILPPAKPHSHYMHVLANFLPPFRWEKDQFIPSNIGEWGGPKKWDNKEGIWALDMHTRHLLLDGWLSLWDDVDEENKGTIWLQPASLSLLYWVARRTGRPHTSDPKTFLGNYKWDRSRWFGGRWPPNNKG